MTSSLLDVTGLADTKLFGRQLIPGVWGGGFPPQVAGRVAPRPVFDPCVSESLCWARFSADCAVRLPHWKRFFASCGIIFRSFSVMVHVFTGFFSSVFAALSCLSGICFRVLERVFLCVLFLASLCPSLGLLSSSGPSPSAPRAPIWRLLRCAAVIGFDVWLAFLRCGLFARRGATWFLRSSGAMTSCGRCGCLVVNVQVVALNVRDSGPFDAFTRRRFTVRAIASSRSPMTVSTFRPMDPCTIGTFSFS